MKSRLGVAGVVCALALGFAWPAAAVIAGGGKKKSDCYATFDGLTATKKTKVICTDGDPSCDSDRKCDGTCTFKVRACFYQETDGCTPQTITKVKKNRFKTSNGTVALDVPTLPIEGAVCGAYEEITVPAQKGKKGRAKGKLVTQVNGKPKSDPDNLQLQCKPRQGDCPVQDTLIPCNTTPCPAQQVVLESFVEGVLTVATLTPFPFPVGIKTTINIGPGDEYCRHEAIVPADGFTVPPFCIPALGFTSSVATRGCAQSPTGAEGKGTVFDGHAACSDLDTIKTGDTMDGTCDAYNQPCDTKNGTCVNDSSVRCDSAVECQILGAGSSCVPSVDGAGRNSNGKVTSVLGDGVCDAPGFHTQLHIPVRSLTWLDEIPPGKSPCCTVNPQPGCVFGNQEFDQGQETVISDFDFILSPTSASASVQYKDDNGDGCFVAGAGPAAACLGGNKAGTICASDDECEGGTCNGPLVLHGTPPAGPCCVVGQETTVVASGIAFSGGAPLYDLIFQNTSPQTIVECNPYPGDQTCTLTNDPTCLGD